MSLLSALLGGRRGATHRLYRPGDRRRPGGLSDRPIRGTLLAHGQLTRVSVLVFFLPVGGLGTRRQDHGAENYRRHCRRGLIASTRFRLSDRSRSTSTMSGPTTARVPLAYFFNAIGIYSMRWGREYSDCALCG